MSSKLKFALQPTRRKFSVPSWVWSLALLAAAFLMLSVYHATHEASAAGLKAPLSQAANQAAPDARRDPDAPNIYTWVRTPSSAWDVPTGAALTNAGQTLHLPDYMRQLAPRAKDLRRAIKFGQAEHPEREVAGYPGLQTTISEQEQALLDRDH